MEQSGVTGQRQKSKHSKTNYRRRFDGPATGLPSSATSASRVPQGKPGARLPTVPERYRVSSDAFTALDFAAVARGLTEAVRLCGLVCPLFRSPPDVPGVSRTLRRNPDGTVTVSVVVRGRSRMAVVADMIDGVSAAHGFDEFQASVLRDALWRAIADDHMVAELAGEISGHTSAGGGSDVESAQLVDARPVAAATAVAA